MKVFGKKGKEIRNRCMAFLLTLCLVIPMCGVSVEAAGSYTRVTDPETRDLYKENFGNPNMTGDLNDESSEFAGGIWTDKSVFIRPIQHKGGQIAAPSEKNFYVDLSAIASTQKMTGQIRVPMDIMIILDMSSSMYDGGARSSRTVNEMVSAVNDTLDSIFTMNTYNRAGVTIYYGGDGYQSSETFNDQSTYAESRYLLLPLDRYTKTGSEFLTVTTTNGGLGGIEVVSGVKDSNGNDETAAFTDIGGLDTSRYSWRGTFSQAGIWDAMDQFLDPNNQTTVEIPGENGTGTSIVTRQPVFIFMADGSPTAATENFSGKKEFSSTAFTPTEENPDIKQTGKNATMGNNTVSMRCPAESDFVTQLTAAYAKQMVTTKYYGENAAAENKSAQFYTIGLALTQNDLALNILDPTPATEAEKTDQTDTIKGYWESLINSSSGSITITSENPRPKDKKEKSTFTHTVTKVKLKDATDDAPAVMFPSNIAQQDYVDKYFEATEVSQLPDAFQNVLAEMVVKEQYVVTDVVNNNNQQGQISFIDKIGKYMEVKDMTGILLNGVYGSGAILASNFQDDEQGRPAAENNLGSIGQPTALGIQFAQQVALQLGLPYDSEDIGQGTNLEFTALIQKAYEAGQLSYTSPTDFSNYIGWYAKKENGAYKFVDSWIEPATSDAVETIPAGAEYRIKSYFYLSPVDPDSYGTLTSNAMYLTVWVVETIRTGEQMVVFSVPAALIPTIVYRIGLGENGEVKSFDITGAEYPIRLIYEVGLRDGIDETTVLNEVDQEYLSKNTNKETGEIYFYTNQYDVSKVGPDSVNTYSYFAPSKQSDRYYYLENSAIYVKSDDGYELYTGTEAPGKADNDTTEYYDKYTYYAYDVNATTPLKIVKKEKYRPVSKLNLDKLNGKAVDGNDPVATGWIQADGKWYIPAGTPIGIDWSDDVSVSSRFDIYKDDPNTAEERDGNHTGTLPYVDYPFVSLDYDRTEPGSQFIVASSLGNNGRISLIPTSGNLKIEKTVDIVSGTPDADLTYPIDVALAGDGTNIAVGSEFSYTKTTPAATPDGQATTVDGTLKVTNDNYVSDTKTATFRFDLKDGESVVIKNLTPEIEATVTENLANNELKYQYFDKTPTFVDTDTVEGNNDIDGVVDIAVAQTVEVKVVNRYDVPTDFGFTKVAAEDTGAALADAEFNLYKLECSDTANHTNHSTEMLEIGLLNKTGDIGCWKYIGTVTSAEEVQGDSSVQKGYVEFAGLYQGTYRLVETKAPAGRILPGGQWMIPIVIETDAATSAKTTVVDINGIQVVGDVSLTPAFVKTVVGGDTELNLPNSAGMDLPITGSIGSSNFMLYGVLIACAAGALLIVFGRMRAIKKQ